MFEKAALDEFFKRIKEAMPEGSGNSSGQTQMPLNWQTRRAAMERARQMQAGQPVTLDYDAVREAAVAALLAGKTLNVGDMIDVKSPDLSGFSQSQMDWVKSGPKGPALQNLISNMPQSPQSQSPQSRRDPNGVDLYQESVQKIKTMKPGDAGWNETRNAVKTLGRDMGTNYQQYLPKQTRTTQRDPNEVSKYQAAVKRLSTLNPSGQRFERTQGVITDLGKKYGFQWQNKIPKAKTQG